MIIIGFGHKKRVGKDTAVNFAMAFARQYFPSVQVGLLSFGNELKDIAYRMFKWAGLQEGMHYENNPREIDEILPPCGKSARQIWDDIGLFGRSIHPKVWVQMGIESAPEADVLFCKDVRFPTEIELIDDFKGFKYRVDRKVPVGGAVDKALDDYKDWTRIIENNGSLREFNTTIKTIVANHLNAIVATDKVVCPICYAKHQAILVSDQEYKCGSCDRGFNTSRN